MALIIEDAVKQQEKVRMALVGPSGSGKTWTALVLARELAGPDGVIVVLDTERRSARKYAKDFKFRVIDKINTFSPLTYIEAMDLMEKEDPAVVIIDGLSPAWSGKDGTLETVDRVAARGQSAFYDKAGWRKATPEHNRMVDRMLELSTRRHLIVTIRVKMAYVDDTNEQGKKVPRKIGLQPIQRGELEYEFDIVADLDQEHTMIVSKSRCPALDKGIFPLPGKAVAQIILDWCNDGAVPGPEEDDDNGEDLPPQQKQVRAPSSSTTTPKDKPPQTEMVIPANLPCAGLAVSALRPAQIVVLLQRVEHLFNTEGAEKWKPLLDALRAHQSGKSPKKPVVAEPTWDEAAKKASLVEQTITLSETIPQEQRSELMQRAFEVTTKKELKVLPYDVLERGYAALQELIFHLPDPGDVAEVFPSQIDVTTSAPPILPDSAIDEDGEVVEEWVDVLTRRAQHLGEAAEEKLASLREDYPALSAYQWADFWIVLGRTGVAA